MIGYMTINGQIKCKEGEIYVSDNLNSDFNFWRTPVNSIVTCSGTQGNIFLVIRALGSVAHIDEISITNRIQILQILNYTELCKLCNGMYYINNRILHFSNGELQIEKNRLDKRIPEEITKNNFKYGQKYPYKKKYKRATLSPEKIYNMNNKRWTNDNYKSKQSN